MKIQGRLQSIMMTNVSGDTLRRNIPISALLVLTLAVLPLLAFNLSAKTKSTSRSVRLTIKGEGFKETFSLPVLREADRPYMKVIPVLNNDSGNDPDRPSAIKIVPVQGAHEEGEILITVSLLYGNVREITSCDKYNALKQDSVQVYKLRDNEAVTASFPKASGLSSLMFQRDYETKTCSGCTCGSLCCAPNAGKCMGCGGCGVCCRN